MDLKTGYFCHATAREIGKNPFTSADMHKKEILSGYHQHDLAASFVLRCLACAFLWKFLFL